MKGEIRVIEVSAQEALRIREKVRMTEIGPRMGEMLSELMAFFQRRKVQMSGPPFSLYRSVTGEMVDVEVGFPVPARTSGEGRVQATVVPGGKAVIATHVGPYESLHETYAGMQAWMASNGVVPAEFMWEQYMTDPQREPDSSKWITQVYWPIK